MSQYAITSTEVIDRLDVLKNLPTFSGLLTEYDRLLAKGAHIAEIVTLLRSDPRISTGLIKSANSARFNPGSKTIQDLGEAIALMGNRDIRLLIVTWNFYNLFHQKSPIQETAYLQHSIVAAILAKNLAHTAEMTENDAFNMGLCHEIGVYLLALYAPEAIESIQKATAGMASRLTASEHSVFQLTHAHVGARIAHKWQQPKSVIMGILGHHNPALVKRPYQPGARLCAVAQAGAFYCGYDNGLVGDTPGKVSDGTMRLLERLKLTQSQYTQACQQAQQEAIDTGLL